MHSLTSINELTVSASHHAHAGDRDSNLHPEVVEKLVHAGFASHFTPARFGGCAGTFRDWVDSVVQVGTADAAAGWAASLTAQLARMATFLPILGQEELWGSSPDSLIVGGLMPVGRATSDSGGWWLEGTWPYVSLINYSQWALLCATSEQGPIFALVPRAEYDVQKTWNVVGMAATGSHTLRLRRTFVPNSRVVHRSSVLNGDPQMSSGTPLKAVNGLTFAAPIVGAGLAAAQQFDRILKRSRERIADAASLQSKTRLLYRARTRIEIAQDTLSRIAERLDKRDSLTDIDIAGMGMRSAEASGNVRDATNILFNAAGTSGGSKDQPLQLIWRNVNTASTHVVLDPDLAADAAYTAAAETSDLLAGAQR